MSETQTSDTCTTEIGKDAASEVKIWICLADSRFVITLGQNGKGELEDEEYKETIDIEHRFSNSEIAEIIAGSHKREKIENEDVDENNDDTEVNEDVVEDAIDGQSYICDETMTRIYELFDQYNDFLSNPVGDPPADEDFNVGKGTQEEFERAMACVMKVARGRGLLEDVTDMTVAYGETDDGPEISGVPEILAPLILEIGDMFQISGGLTYEYVDENDGRTTAYTPYPTEMDLLSIEEAYSKSAREILGAEMELKEVFKKYGTENSMFLLEVVLEKEPAEEESEE